MQKSYQKNEHEIYLENEAGERIAEILFPEVLFARTGKIIRISISSTGDTGPGYSRRYILAARAQRCVPAPPHL